MFIVLNRSLRMSQMGGELVSREEIGRRESFAFFIPPVVMALNGRYLAWRH
jgi:hypothetical protein